MPEDTYRTSAERLAALKAELSALEADVRGDGGDALADVVEHLLSNTCKDEEAHERLHADLDKIRKAEVASPADAVAVCRYVLEDGGGSQPDPLHRQLIERLRGYLDGVEVAPEGPTEEAPPEVDPGSLGDAVDRYFRLVGEANAKGLTNEETDARNDRASDALHEIWRLPVVTGRDVLRALDLLTTDDWIQEEDPRRLADKLLRWCRNVCFGTEDDLDELEALLHALNTAGISLVNEGYDVDGTTIARLANMGRDHLKAVSIAINGDPRP